MAEENDQLAPQETDDKPSEEPTREIIPLHSEVPELISAAVKQLRDDMMALGESKEHVIFLMAVNVNTAKADLVPIPTLDNMNRMNEHLEQFPEAVKMALRSSMPEPDMKAAQSIWAFLDSTKSRTKGTQMKANIPEN